MASNKEWKRQRREKKRNDNECYDCGNPRFPDRTRCLKCLELDAHRALKWKNRNRSEVRRKNRQARLNRIEAGLCGQCGASRDEHDPQTKCMNCSQGVFSADYKPYLAQRL